MADQREDKGNIFMLKEKLSSNKLDQKKQAMKTIISAMTVGEDVSPLFSAVNFCLTLDRAEHGE